ncbi:hypothetical protein LTR84_008930 [Exophiala bonariae]|uniref:tRNA (guanine(37)-N1)-methyltransferase n=1 Tax=Exophiala bonariae TaxID=1690606 RepID=A0AAV9MX30_9EURO|nr:hypothetical protein LTR84_008930 [Exophiala bonariae]
MNPADVPEIFKPPINRSMQVLDRSFFQKVVRLSALSITDFKQISNVRSQLTKSQATIAIPMIKILREDDLTPGAKCLLLRPGIDADQPSTWPQAVSDLVESGTTKIRPFDLKLTYDDWTMHNILEAILPDMLDDDKETPTGFAHVGHVAHINLRTQYLPYKELIGQVLLDKNPTVKTVINKTFDVGTESVFRTFPYEVLAGPDDLDVTVHESSCEFKFNFGKVYWNPRLGTEHARLFESFQEGEAVCDVMAGVGPFAVPAGKRKVFVHANDLNPDSYTALQDAITRNKVDAFVNASCEDGRLFIRNATNRLAMHPRSVLLPSKIKVPRYAGSNARRRSLERAAEKSRKTLSEPRAFSHYVMNLPATAIEFLDAFTGVYQGREAEFSPQTNTKLPFIHLYLFQAKYEDDREELEEICQRISQHLGGQVRRDDPELDVNIRYVRLVAPNKKMYCASFRIPASVAFAQQPVV